MRIEKSRNRFHSRCGKRLKAIFLRSFLASLNSPPRFPIQTHSKPYCEKTHTTEYTIIEFFCQHLFHPKRPFPFHSIGFGLEGGRNLNGEWDLLSHHPPSFVFPCLSKVVTTEVWRSSDIIALWLRRKMSPSLLHYLWVSFITETSPLQWKFWVILYGVQYFFPSISPGTSLSLFSTKLFGKTTVSCNP